MVHPPIQRLPTPAERGCGGLKRTCARARLAGSERLRVGGQPVGGGPAMEPERGHRVCERQRGPERAGVGHAPVSRARAERARAHLGRQRHLLVRAPPAATAELRGRAPSVGSVQGVLASSLCIELQ